jgi:hypothetical protein
MLMSQRSLVTVAALVFAAVLYTQGSTYAQQAPSVAQAPQSQAPAPGGPPPSPRDQAPRDPLGDPRDPAPRDPFPREQAPSQALATAEGELLDVDTKASTLLIKTSAAEMKFRYDSKTKVTGAQKGVSGLATMTGSDVTIQYKKDGSANLATSIEVRPSQAAPAPRP